MPLKSLILLINQFDFILYVCMYVCMYINDYVNHYATETLPLFISVGWQDDIYAGK